MTDQHKPLTAKQWERRALKAEAELESLKKIRQFDADREMQALHIEAVKAVALREIEDAIKYWKETV